jgi:serine/threonine-protein kinase SRPK3
MSSLLRWARNSIRRAPSLPLRFPTSGFALVPDPHLLEEERFEDFRCGKYYPVNIGDVFASKYQVIGKLGFGVSSTVWLAHDLEYVEPSPDLPTLKLTRLIDRKQRSSTCGAQNIQP